MRSTSSRQTSSSERSTASMPRIEDEELALGEIADHRTAQALCVGPGPTGALLAIAEGQRNLVDDEIRTAAIGEWKHCNLERRVLLIVGRDLDVHATGIEFDHPIEEGLAAVAEIILLLKERPPFLRALTDLEHPARPARAAASMGLHKRLRVTTRPSCSPLLQKRHGDTSRRSKKHAGELVSRIAMKVRLFPSILRRGIVFDFEGSSVTIAHGVASGRFVPDRLALHYLRENLSSAEKITPIREPATTADRSLVSVVVPVYNEAANLSALWARLEPVMRTCGRPWEVLFVDDGSADQSLDLLRQFAASAHGAVRVVELARNFGQHSAILAGFRQCRGQIVVTLDADLQNPPEEIPRLLAAIDEGNDVVGGWREVRQDFAYRRFASNLQNRVTSMIVGVPMHDYGCMLRAYRRHIVDTVVACDEKAAFVPALANSFAKRVAEIPVGHDERQSGSSKYNLFRLVHLSLNLITGFSMMPIRAVSVAGILVFVLDALLVLLLLAHRILYGPQQEGALWTLFAFNFLVLGFVLLAVGLIGEYVGRIYLEVRKRPTYIVRAVHGDESDSPERR
jgi:undecaprenyl-phosphate 4-deoxy-4-formamido-L-arabinose transferase